VPALVRLMGDPDMDLKLAAATALERYGPAAKRAVTDLIGTAVHGDAELRVASMRCLIAIGGSEANLAIPALRTALAASDPRVRAMAAEVLGKLGPSAKDAEPDLQKALHDNNAQVQKAAGDALLSILRK
jgi:HEAT repeat protein